MRLIARFRPSRSLLPMCLVLVVCSAAAQVQESALKAAFIYNFAIFTSWPDHAAAGPFIVCVDAGTPLAESLRQLEGKRVDDRRWKVKETADDPRKTGRCSIAVIQSTATQQTNGPVATTLVVSDGGVSGKNGAVITLVNEGDRVKFDIDLKQAERTGVKFSAKLLQLARNVI